MSPLDKEAAELWLVCDGPIEDQLVLDRFNADRHHSYWHEEEYREFKNECEALAKMGL